MPAPPAGRTRQTPQPVQKPKGPGPLSCLVCGSVGRSPSIWLPQDRGRPCSTAETGRLQQETDQTSSGNERVSSSAEREAAGDSQRSSRPTPPQTLALRGPSPSLQQRGLLLQRPPWAWDSPTEETGHFSYCLLSLKRRRKKKLKNSRNEVSGKTSQCYR